MDNKQLQERIDKTVVIKTKAEELGAIEATQGIVDMVKQEIGDYKVTKEHRDKAAEKLGVDADVASGWQKISDILNHIDTVELAKKHPGEINKGLKAVVGVVGIFVPAVASIGNLVPENAGAKIVEMAGWLTPEHLLNTLAKNQVKKKTQSPLKKDNDYKEKAKTVRVQVRRVK